MGHEKKVPGSVQFSPEWRGGNLGPMWRDNSHGRTPDTLLRSVRSCWRSSRTDLVWLTGCRWSQSSKNADSGEEHESNARRSTAPHQNRPVIQWQSLVLFRTRKDHVLTHACAQDRPNVANLVARAPRPVYSRVQRRELQAGQL